MTRKVVHAVCHEGVFIPGVGNIGKTLSLNSSQFKYNRELKLEWEPGTGLLWYMRGRSGIVPAASVFLVEFAPSETPVAALDKKSQAV